MTRCSHCNSDGHNNRTCSTKTSAAIGGGDGGVKLFGVRLTDGSFIKKSASMGNIPHNSTAAAADSPQGYHSDGTARGSVADHALHRAKRKKGSPWTEEEHWKFLRGLKKLGRGDWRGISKNFVPSRTPTQVASHAQKYFIRQSNMTRKKKRSSLFDMAPDMETDSSSTPEQLGILPQPTDTDNEKLVLSSSQQAAVVDNSLPSLDLSLKPAFTPLPFQLWPPNASASYYDELGTSHSQIYKLIPLVQKEPAKELVGISHLALVETGTVQIEQSSLSLRLPGEP